jgi:hypothetical protein
MLWGITMVEQGHGNAVPLRRHKDVGAHQGREKTPQESRKSKYFLG